jgi:hypothetical protein
MSWGDAFSLAHRNLPTRPDKQDFYCTDAISEEAVATLTDDLAGLPAVRVPRR